MKFHKNYFAMSRKLQYSICVQIFFGLCAAFPQTHLPNANNAITRDYFDGDIFIREYEIEFPIRPQFETSDQTKLHIQFGYLGRDQQTTLTLVEDRDLADRATTGLFFAESDANAHQNVKYTPRPDFFDDIGEFEFFQNPEDLSAVTRFTNSSSGEVTYTGILKERYILNDVSSSFSLNFGWITMFGYIQYINKTVGYQDSNSTVAAANEDPAKNASNSTTQQSPPPVRSPPAIVYPKILLSPSFNLTNRETGVAHFVKELIAHLNCVDMSFRQLSDPQVHLHISGIIIPLDDSATPYFLAVPNMNYTEYNTIHRTSEYFVAEMQRFPPYTYDIVAPLTEKYLAQTQLGYVTQLAGGLAQIGTLCNRINGQGIAGATATVSYAMDYKGIQHMTHEFGHILNANHEGAGPASDCDKNGRFTMNLAEFGSLRWSSCSKRSISEFLKTDAAACTHSRPVPLPESVKSMQGAWLTVPGQCLNLFKDAKGGCVAGPVGNVCQSYGCTRNGTCILNPQQPPMEGSGCEGEKRCIAGDCVKLPNL